MKNKKSDFLFSIFLSSKCGILGQITKKVIVTGCLSAAFPLYSLMNTSPPLCECDLPAGADCDRNCEWICDMGVSLKEGTDKINEKCRKTAKAYVRKKPLVADTVNISNLKETLGKLQEEALKGTAGSPVDKKCPNCATVQYLDVDIRPSQYKKDSCPQRYIKTHNYQKKISFPGQGGCDRANYKKELYKRAQDYVKSLTKKPFFVYPAKSWEEMSLQERNQMSAAEKLWLQCPSGCSFYINYSVTTVRKFCHNILNLQIHCDHQKAGGIFSTKYDVKANEVTDVVCKGFENDKLVMRKLE